jgi:hypothetical protein
MDEWEYCLLWASPRKTVVIKPGGQMEKFTRNSRSTGILSGLQAEGWQTVAFDIAPSVDMTYLFRRRVANRGIAAKAKPTPNAPIYRQAPEPYPQTAISHN